MKPPAVWLPYRKMGQSPTDVMLDDSGGKFGPFDGQLFVGEFTQASVNRVYLEKVGGEYQGACFPFRRVGVRGPAAGPGARRERVCRPEQPRLEQFGPGLVRPERLVWTGRVRSRSRRCRPAPTGSSWSSPGR